MEFPLGGFGVAIATVVLPKLSSHHSQSEAAHFSVTLDWGLRWVMLIGLSASIGLALLAGPLLSTLFQSGRFTFVDVKASQACLVAYSLGIIGFMLVKMLASAYYAKQNIKAPVKIAMLTVVANIVLSLILIKPFSYIGLAIASALSALFNAACLACCLIKQKHYTLQPGWPLFLARLLVALLVMAMALNHFCPPLDSWMLLSKWTQASTLFFLLILGAISYIGTLLLTGLTIKDILIKPEYS